MPPLTFFYGLADLSFRPEPQEHTQPKTIENHHQDSYTGLSEITSGRLVLFSPYFEFSGCFHIFRGEAIALPASERIFLTNLTRGKLTHTLLLSLHIAKTDVYSTIAEAACFLANSLHVNIISAACLPSKTGLIWRIITAVRRC